MHLPTYGEQAKAEERAVKEAAKAAAAEERARREEEKAAAALASAMESLLARVERQVVIYSYII